MNINIEEEMIRLRMVYLSDLKQLHQKVFVQLEKIELEIKAVELDRTVEVPNVDDNSTSLILSRGDIERLRNSTWSEILLWGVARLGNEASLAELVDEISKLPIEQVIKRKEPRNNLYQALRIQAEGLTKTGELEKIRSDEKRKGGFVYRLLT